MNLDRRQALRLGVAAASAPLLAPRVARAAGRTLRIGHNNSATSSLQAASIVFQKFMAEKTDGRFEVTIAPDSQLGSDVQLVRAVADGTLDMTISATAILGSYHPDLELAEIPFLFGDVAGARKALAGNLGAYYAGLLAKSSLAVIGWGENGFRHVTANRPVRSPADLKGLKIRVQPAKIQLETFLGLGAAAASLTFTELPEALRTGRFEAQENPLGIITSNAFIPRFQSHVCLTGHVYSPFAVNFSADVLEELRPADRELVKEGGKLAAQVTLDFADAAVANGLQTLKASGMTVVADVDRGAFRSAMEALNPRLAAVAGPDAIARIRGLVA